jgi:transcriptional regulator with XRE-family HTH domain
LSGIRPQEVEGARVVEICVGDDSPSEEEFRFHTVGEQLKAERERQALTLSDLAAKTRVPMRHLDSIEKSEFGALPGTTYTMDAAKVSADLRIELATGGHEGYQAPTQNYEPADPSRVPSRAIAWTAAVIGVVVVAAYLIWRSMTLDASVNLTAPAPVEQKTTAAPTNKSAIAAPGGAVVLTATHAVWVKVYDTDNKRLYENEMKAGDSFTVPPEANKPMIVTGRPQVLSVTVGGKTVAPLGGADKTIADVEVSAMALLARSQTQASSPTASAAPAGNRN